MSLEMMILTAVALIALVVAAIYCLWAFTRRRPAASSPSTPASAHAPAMFSVFPARASAAKEPTLLDLFDRMHTDEEQRQKEERMRKHLYDLIHPAVVGGSAPASPNP